MPNYDSESHDAFFDKALRRFPANPLTYIHLVRSGLVEQNYVPPKQKTLTEQEATLLLYEAQEKFRKHEENIRILNREKIKHRNAVRIFEYLEHAYAPENKQELYLLLNQRGYYFSDYTESWTQRLAQPRFGYSRRV